MAFVSLKDFLARTGLGSDSQIEEWTKAWRIATESGSQEPLLAFICRERGLAEDVFLQSLAKELGWPYLDLAKATVPNEARNKISTKIAFQFAVIPTDFKEGMLQVVVSNPFDAAMLNAVRFDARGPVEVALAPKAELEKALGATVFLPAVDIPTVGRMAGIASPQGVMFYVIKYEMPA